MFTNQLLIAMPTMNNTIFNHGVVYICEHSEAGAIGLIVNQPTEYNLKFIFDQLDIRISLPEMDKKPVLFGGPIQPDRGFVLHRPCLDFEASLNVSQEVSISTSKENLSKLATGNGPNENLVALGYAGWGAQQLDKEIRDNIWLNCPATASLLYDTRFENRWEKAINSLGIDVNQLSTGLGHA